MIGRLHHLVLDCPDPDLLARFYSELLGWPITWQQPDWVVVAVDDRTSGLAFQPVADYRAPDWPDPAHPQQLHLDVMVDDQAAAASPGAGPGRPPAGRRRSSDEQPGSGPWVFADPAGHPFCLIPRPSWAPPVNLSSPAPGVEP